MKTIIIVVIVTLVALIGYSFITTAVDNAAEETSLAEAAEKNTISYAVSGEVAKPGTYVVSSQATMYDLIEAAGGVTTNADPLSYDVTFTLRSADKSYYIAPLIDISDTCTTSPILKANINSDSADTIHEITGLSNSLSAALVAYRETAYFQALEMVKDVPGIGPATYLAIRNKITLREGEI